MEGGNIARLESAQMVMTAGSGHDLHQFNRCLEEIGQFAGCWLDHQFFPAIPVSGSRSSRAVLLLHILAATQPMACMAELARAMPSAPSAIALMKSGAVRSPPVMIKLTSAGRPYPDNAGPGASAGMVGTEIWSRNSRGAAACAAAAAIQDDVVGAGLKGEGDIRFDVIGGQFEADRDAPRDRAHVIGQPLEVSRAVKVPEGRWRNGVLAGGKARTCAIFSVTFAPGKWPPVPVLAP